MAAIILARLQAEFGASIIATSHAHGNETAVVEPYRLLEVARFVRDEPDLSLKMPVDCSAVDFAGLPDRKFRFEVVWHLYSLEHRHRLRLKVQVDEAMPQVQSLQSVWPGMNWHERETWDLYGIRFLGHPDLRRILLYEEFVGHPLRKEYPIDKRQPLIPLRTVREVPTQRHAPTEVLNRP